MDLEYAAAVSDYISTCTENIKPTKICKIYPIDKPWINCEVPCYVLAPLHLPQVTLRNIKMPVTMYENQSERPRDITV